MRVVVVGIGVNIPTADLSQEIPEHTLRHVELSQQIQSREHESDNIVQIRGGEVHHVEFPAVQDFFGDLAGQLDVCGVQGQRVHFADGACVVHVLLGVVAGGVGLWNGVVLS